jgi:hypothetical protein
MLSPISPLERPSPAKYGFIFVRFRRVKNSNRVLDAWDYGHKAWKIPVRKKH